MTYGTFEVMQICFDADGNQILTATGEGNMSLAFIQSWRMIEGCFGLNVIIALLSTIALILVASRRFEVFSFTSLILFTVSSAAVSTLQVT